MLANQIIKNSNGKEYKVIASNSQYALLEKVDGSFQPYVVAQNLKQYPEGYSWGQGYYFKTLESAQEYYDNH